MGRRKEQIVPVLEAVLIPMRAPVFLDTLTDAPVGQFSEIDVREVAELAAQAAKEARQKADRAMELAEDAKRAQVRIHAHNQECDKRMPWNKPANWRKHGNGSQSYQGYTTRDAEGFFIPHGEGESTHPSTTYRCANFDRRNVAGLVVETFADGSTSAGSRFEEKGIAELIHTSRQMNAVFAGYWTTSADVMSLKLGMITYPDKSVYYGYCSHVQSLDHVAPSGFGVWSDDGKITVFAGFEDGFADGVALFRMAAGKQGDYLGAFSKGRLLNVSEGL